MPDNNIGSRFKTISTPSEICSQMDYCRHGNGTKNLYNATMMLLMVSTFYILRHKLRFMKQYNTV